MSKAYEVTHIDNGVNDRLTQQKHYIYAGDEVIAIQIRTLKNGAKTPDETRYLHKDALGNIDTITDSKGAVIQRISYDPFGNRTVSSGDPDKKAWTARGFTGHEHLEGLGLVHMNARLYDPEIGRFISPDTYIQAPEQSQNYNRYVYVLNNPLKYTDPSGHFFWLVAAFFFVAAVVTDIPILDTIATIAFAAVLGPGAGWMGAMLKGAAAGFVSGLVSGTNPFKAALWGAVSAGSAWGIGHGVGGSMWKNGTAYLGEGSIGTQLAHGVSQGAITQLRGGSFKSGFVGAVAGGLGGQAAGSMMGGIRGLDAGAIMARTAIAGVFGGLASQATGGSFEDGALSAAFSHLFNEEAVALEENNYSWGDFLIDGVSGVLTGADILLGGPTGEGILPAMALQTLKTGAKAGVKTLSKSQLKSISSLEKQIAEHETKLAEYLKDPMKYDNKGFLKNAPNDTVRQQIIQSRANHLQKEIQTFKDNIRKIHDGEL